MVWSLTCGRSAFSTHLATPGRLTTDVAYISTVQDTSPFHSILNKFPHITKLTRRPTQCRHTTVHHIQTTKGPPVASRPRRLAPEKLHIAKKKFKAMLDQGTARPVSSPASGTHKRGRLETMRRLQSAKLTDNP